MADKNDNPPSVPTSADPNRPPRPPIEPTGVPKTLPAVQPGAGSRPSVDPGVPSGPVPAGKEVPHGTVETARAMPRTMRNPNRGRLTIDEFDPADDDGISPARSIDNPTLSDVTDVINRATDAIRRRDWWGVTDIAADAFAILAAFGRQFSNPATGARSVRIVAAESPEEIDKEHRDLDAAVEGFKLARDQATGHGMPELAGSGWRATGPAAMTHVGAPAVQFDPNALMNVLQAFVTLAQFVRSLIGK